MRALLPAGGDRTERLVARALLALVLALPPGRLEDALVLCPFRRATGVPCPVCGITRSWSATLRGRVWRALSYHPLGPVTLPLAVAFALGLVNERTLRTAWERRPRLIALLVSTWIAVWLIRVAVAREGGRSRVP